MGNYMRTISYRYGRQWCHAEWETIRKKFSAVMKDNGAMSNRKLILTIYKKK